MYGNDKAGQDLEYYPNGALSYEPERNERDKFYFVLLRWADGFLETVLRRSFLLRRAVFYLGESDE